MEPSFSKELEWLGDEKGWGHLFKASRQGCEKEWERQDGIDDIKKSKLLVISFYNFLGQESGEELQGYLECDALTKVGFFAWEAYQGKFLTLDRLQRGDGL